MLLVGDVGGTKTSLAVFKAEGGALTAPVAEAIFPSADYPDFESLLREFMNRTSVKVDRAVFGVAGPVLGGRSKITNLHWSIDEEHIRSTLGIPWVRLLNDLVAIAYAVPFLQEDDLEVLHQGQPVKGGTIAVVAPGTGLGEAFLTWDGTHYTPYASEGGHTDFGPLNERELGLLQFMQLRIGHVSYESVCSGIGIPNIYLYLKEASHEEEPPWLAEELSRADDPTPVIVNAALKRGDEAKICVAAMEMFVSILGAEAGNLALKVLATGGVYLAGGIPPRIISLLKSEHFIQAFSDKGRMRELMTQIPVHVILNPQVARIGAAHYGLLVKEGAA